jgi:hypothetical protein
MKQVLPALAAIVCGFVALVDFFIPHPAIDAVGAALVEGVVILAAFALLLGLLNLITVHAQRISAGEPHSRLSVVLIVALGCTLALGVALPGSVALNWVFTYLYYPLQATMAALLAFFVVHAVYRAFQLRSVEAAILLVSGLLFLFLQMPFVAGLSPALPALRAWLLAVPVTAGMRGILLGIALGTIATALRVLLAVDRPYA